MWIGVGVERERERETERNVAEALGERKAGNLKWGGKRLEQLLVYEVLP